MNAMVSTSSYSHWIWFLSSSSSSTSISVHPSRILPPNLQQWEAWLGVLLLILQWLWILLPFRDAADLGGLFYIQSIASHRECMTEILFSVESIFVNSLYIFELCWTLCFRTDLRIFLPLLHSLFQVNTFPGYSPTFLGNEYTEPLTMRLFVASVKLS